jgi:hypothetical protein
MTTLETTDIDQARQYFDRTLARVIEVTHGLSEAQWRFKPAADRWSVADNLEHMVVVQERVLGPILERLAQSPAPPPDRDSRFYDALVREKIPDRSIRVKGPDAVTPGGQMAPAEALERVARNYRRLAEAVETAPGLRGHIMESAPIKIVTGGQYDTLDGFQWLLAASAHDERHVRQILEIKADPNYPA